VTAVGLQSASLKGREQVDGYHHSKRTDSVARQNGNRKVQGGGSGAGNWNLECKRVGVKKVRKREVPSRYCRACWAGGSSLPRRETKVSPAEGRGKSREGGVNGGGRQVVCA